MWLNSSQNSKKQNLDNNRQPTAKEKKFDSYSKCIKFNIKV